MNNRLLLALSVFALLLPLTVSSAAVAGENQDAAVTIREVEPFPYCAILHKGPYMDMTTVVGQLVGAMQSQGLFPQVRGPMVGVYHNSPAAAAPADLSWEAGFIVTAQTAPQPPLVKKTWEHRTVAAALHIGPYAKGGETVVKIMDWMTENGYEPAGETPTCPA